MAKRPELEVTGGELKAKRFTIKDGGVRLGRSSSNDIHVPDEELSRNHCMFEPVGEDGIRLTDLASANGTKVNGVVMGNDPVMLKVGDVIEVGTTMVKVVGDGLPKANVDLGLEKKEDKAGTKAKRSPIANVLWLVASVGLIAAIYLLMTGKLSAPQTSEVVAQTPDEDMTLVEAYYEKVEADSQGIFRYEMKFSEDGVLTAKVDDVPKENRHMVKSELLNDEAKAMLGEILSYKSIKDIDREYVGADSEPPVLKSWTLKVVYASRSRSIRVVNIQEPDAFRAVRERLEAFSKNQLGIWALQYSRDKLVKLSEDAFAVGKAKWDDREVQYGNLFGAVTAFREAIFYLETVDPKPECHERAVKSLKEAEELLNERYSNQRFVADRALKMAQWEEAKRELGVLLEMIPDRNDERYREASAKMVDIENRMKGGR